MKKLVLVLLLSISFISYADSTCTWQYGNTYKCKEDRRFEGPDMEKAGIGLRNILRWLNENSTSNTNNKVYIPPNGYASGNTFKCLTGFKKSGSQCIKEKSLPANAIAYGDDFKCKYGFFKEYGTSCKKIPTNNAYAYGVTWFCNGGYIKTGNQCLKKEERPENSFLLSNGGWKCKVRYEKIENKCIREQTQVLETDSKNESLEKPAKEVEKQAEFLEKISQAKSLLDSGIISDEEFSNITKRIIEKSQENTSLKTQKLEDKAKIIKQLLAKEVQDEQDTARSLISEDQLNTLKSAYKNNIIARIKTSWRYQSAEDGWSCGVYVIQDRQGQVKAVDVRNCNVGNSSLAKSFRDSIERAVYKASPLPAAPDEAVFDSEIYMLFSVN